LIAIHIHTRVAAYINKRTFQKATKEHSKKQQKSIPKSNKSPSIATTAAGAWRVQNSEQDASLVPQTAIGAG